MTRLGEYVYRVQEAPVLTTEDEGVSVTMSSQLHVTRLRDRGFGDDWPPRVMFQPGMYHSSHDEVYGTVRDVRCARDRLEVDESTTCEVGFTTRRPEEIADSYWWVEGVDVAAWPGQS
ncbi:MAG: hypothetical protein Q4G43_09835 [Mobilicoccus sp.]|nr:hypothetical protein [Mobilicoccus sp.]